MKLLGGFTRTAQWCGIKSALTMSWWRFVFPVLVWIHAAHCAEFTAIFPSSETSHETLDHLTMDVARERIYVGAVNTIYELSADLSVERQYSTGPVKDNPVCISGYTGDTCRTSSFTTLPATDTDNVNKILVLDKDNHQVIVCGSVRQGRCETLDLNDISVTKSSFITNSDTVYNIAANDRDNSTVAFIAPCSGGNNCLYVGSSFSGVEGVTDTREQVPEISTRQIFNSSLIFKPFGRFTSGGSYSRIQISGGNVVINYITGFSSAGFSYFLTTQRKDDVDATSGYISKIVQVCQTDESYKSYMEIELQCKQGGTLYNMVNSAALVSAGSQLASGLGVTAGSSVLVATFSQSDGATQDLLHGSAVCAFPLERIRQQFTDNIKRCFNGSQSKTGLHFGDQDCLAFVPSSVTLNTKYCGHAYSTLPAAGELPLVGSALKVLGSDTVTSLAADVVDIYTVLYLGTTTGHIKKMVLKSSSSSDPYDDITVQEGSSVRSDMTFDPSRTHLYAMTQNKLVKMPLQQCSVSQSCEDCRAMNDPYCGWCSLQKKCSMRSECENYEDDKRWLSLDAYKCISIESLMPARAAVNRQIRIKIGIQYLPPNEGYKCDFQGQSIEATVTSNEISCLTPANTATTIPAGQDHAIINLKIRSSETDVAFLQKEFTFYDCGKHIKCSACAKSQWSCRWCIHQNRCVPERGECTSGSVVDSVGSCPALYVPSSDILIPVNYLMEIHLRGENLPTPEANQAGYKCLLHITAPPVIVPAKRVSSTEVVCHEHEYTYAPSADFKTESLEVVWGDNYDVEDNNGITAIVYKCHEMATDCSECIGLLQVPARTKYGCTFCGASCNYSGACGPSNPPVSACPKPYIDKVEPLSSPLQGQTPVTITGTNLGSKFTDIKSVRVAGEACTPVRDLYQVSKRIVCTTASVQNPASGNIQVSIGADTVPHAGPFHYQDPKPATAVPSKGPLAGGTMITVQGESLLTGSNIQVLIGVYPCIVNRTLSNNSQLVCRTKPVSPPPLGSVQERTVSVTFDSLTLPVGSEMFVFMPNPNITNIQPLKSYNHGGRVITVTGTNLDSVAFPKLYLSRDSFRSRETICTVKKETHMVCDAPAVNSSSTSGRKRRAVAAVSAEVMNIGLIMDGIHCRQDLHPCFPAAPQTMEVFPDPFYYDFKGGKKTFKSETITLDGDNLDLACTKDEVVVEIGSTICKIDLLERNRLLCTIDANLMKDMNNDNNKRTQDVNVRVFNSLVFTPGKLEYEVPPNESFWIIIVAVGGGVLTTIIVIIAVVYKRRSANVERQNKKLQIQLDTLESNVRNECKQAFAELQTEVSDFTSDLNVIGIPFWDYKMYTFKVLFPSLKDHPILHNNIDINTSKFGGYEQGLQQFNQLLNSKQFLLIFIRTLEQQRNFSIRDKAVTASLLMIVLQDKMEYATEILKALLNELIDRSVERRHPKLMLRRTESVVEKLLSNWLSLSMYIYLKKNAGKTLFMLFKAIKHQTEKGPIDVFNSEAKYSLSEDRLLREKVEPMSLTAHLVTPDSKEPVACKVLDCDTITQAKEKALDAIYMNAPFSRRPSVYDIDLEWRSGKSGHLPLQDEDVTTQTVSGWKRVNTLLHYHVPDGATMALVPAKNKNDMVRQVHGMIEIGSSMSSLPPIVTMEEGTKVWHLLRHDSDNQNVSRAQKVISEIFLTRLLATKGTLQQYIDDLFLTILKVDSTLPPAIKYLFDFLDNAARRHNITDPEVVYTWKSNSLPLRFWVNMIKNPEFVFDIHKSNIVDSCLSVIAQTFMDSCSTSEHRLGKDSPTNKLLFAKDIPRYRHWVERFYKSVHDAAPISDQEMTRVMTEMSMTNLTDFNVSVALKELYKYAMQYNFELLEALDDDPSAKKLHLANRFEQVQAIMEGTPLYGK